jgi:hypothetical protein
VGAIGAGQQPCDLSGAGLPRESIPLQITSDLTLTNDIVWGLDDITHVNSGATLTIEPCTRIEGARPPTGFLVVSQGGKIQAVGAPDAPILFTSAVPPGDRLAGDWGGIALLGRAPTFSDADETLWGFPDQPENMFGGNDPFDNSGTLSYVRIEFGGFEIGEDLYGLAFAGVGSRTTIDHVMVSHVLDDCFAWFGGTVGGAHLVCNDAGDDMFDIDLGYQGHLQFLFGRQVSPVSSNPNGFECDSSNDGNMPVSRPTVSNVTLCGLADAAHSGEAIGAVFREGLEGNFSNLILTGFERGIDVRDDFGTQDSPNVEVTGSVLFNNFVDNIAPEETDDADNDFGFDEIAWITDPSRNNSEANPGFTCGPEGVPMPYPPERILGVTPAPGLATSANYAGAFRDANDTWMTGAWVDWAEH